MLRRIMQTVGLCIVIFGHTVHGMQYIQAALSSTGHTLYTCVCNISHAVTNRYDAWYTGKRQAEMTHITDKLDRHELDIHAICKLPPRVMANSMLQEETEHMLTRLEICLRHIADIPEYTQTNTHARQRTSIINNTQQYNRSDIKTDIVPNNKAWIQSMRNHVAHYKDMPLHYAIGYPSLEEARDLFSHLQQWVDAVKAYTAQYRVDNIRDYICAIQQYIYTCNANNTSVHVPDEDERHLPFNMWLSRTYWRVNKKTKRGTFGWLTVPRICALLGTYVTTSWIVDRCHCYGINNAIYQYSGGALTLSSVSALTSYALCARNIERPAYAE